MLTSEVPQPSLVLPETSTDTPPSVLTQQAFSPAEIERICRAFIQLISAECDENPTTHTQESTIVQDKE